MTWAVHLPDRILDKIEFLPNGCWKWTGGHRGPGYSHISWNGRSWLGHRAVYEMLVGPIPQGLTIDHVKARGCEHRDCINPDHLEPVTQKENNLRGNTFQARNAAKTHCDRGHPLSGSNLYVPPGRAVRHCRACKSVNAARHRKRKAALS